MMYLPSNSRICRTRRAAWRLWTLGLAVVAVGAWYVGSVRQTREEPMAPPPDVPAAPARSVTTAPDRAAVVPPESAPLMEWQATLGRARGRVTKKPFSIFVDPKHSPVQPERFTGYHTGADFEILPGEENVDVTVRAACTGPVVEARQASGYGGVVVQSCRYDGAPVTVVYGHIRLSSVRAEAGAELAVGDPIGVLGTGYSAETDGERTHLHLGVHRGTDVNIRGYVATQMALADWLDPCSLGTVCGSGS